MAVIMTTQFCVGVNFRNLSKVVFTSPNIDSPNIAGTRSHILPGRADLALWYEDITHMYEIEPSQITYDTSYYYYYYTVINDIDLDSDPTTARITVGNYEGFRGALEQIVDLGEPIGYVDVTPDIIKETLDPGYLSKIIDSLDKIYYSGGSTISEPTYKKLYCPPKSPIDAPTVLDTTGYYTAGWKVEIIDKIGEGVEECYIDFEFSTPTKVTYMTMEATKIYTSKYHWTCGAATWMVDHWHYEDNTYVKENEAIYSFIGNFKIQGKEKTPGAEWVDLHTGYFGYGISEIEACFGEVIMTDNVNYYTYYRILILNNDSFEGLTAGCTWNYNCFSIRNLKFYNHEYEPLVVDKQNWEYDYMALLSFEDDLNRREVQVVAATSVSGDPIESIYDTDTNIEGTINISTEMVGSTPITKYIINVNEVGVSSVDYLTIAEGYSAVPTISGTTGIDGTIGTTNIATDLNVLSTGYMEVTGETKIENGYIYSNLSGQQVDLTYIGGGFDITTDITYTIMVSGVVSSGTIGDVPVTGHTNRYEDRYSAQRGYCYDVTILDTIGTGIIPTATILHSWDGETSPDFSTGDSVVFKLTLGEAYDCRLTAWDDVTHSTILNDLIAGDYVRVSALAFRATGDVLTPETSFDPSPNTYIASPIYNRIFKGNIVYEGVNYYYGDFDLSYRTEPDMIGDYLIFKPMLHNVDEEIPYGIHDHVIVFHYTYT